MNDMELAGKTLTSTGIYSQNVLESTVDAWFSSNGWQVFNFQRDVWAAYAQGQSGLIHSATGSGKTLAAWLAPVLVHSDAHTGNEGETMPLTVLWITPMRALAHDTRLSLEKPIRALNLPWTVGSRTGDTSSAERARQAKRMPSALITTPESLSLMLTQTDAQAQMQHLQCVVVDEWHEMIGNKRGVQVELALARLRRWRPSLRTWGLSATLGNMPEAMAVMMGTAGGGCIVEGVRDKKIVIDTLLPSGGKPFPWAGHLGFAMLGEVAAEIEATAKAGGSTLVFTNTRSQAELWYQALLAAKPDWAGAIALHHGSLDRDVRDYVEAGLKSGMLMAVVATSSLDLGVDFSPVARVLQIGSPKGVARLLQRAGRSGHAPGQVSRVTCVPTHAFEFVESLAAQRAAYAGKIEARRPVSTPLDVLIQHLVTTALSGKGDAKGFEYQALLDEIRSTHAFADLTETDFDWALDFVTRGGEALHAYPEYRKVERSGERYVVNDGAIARRHRMAIGTIVSDASMDIRYMKGARLGHVEESFVARLSPGDAFTFAGKTLELIRVREMTAYVKPAKKIKNLVPQWTGGKMPLSTQLADSVRDVLEDIRQARAGDTVPAEIAVIERLFRVQRAMSRIPARHELLIEQIETREGHHLFFYPFAGRHVHTGLAALFGFRLGQLRPATFSFTVNDYGFELLSETSFVLSRDLLDSLLSCDQLLSTVLQSLNVAEHSKRHFREIARVAGLIFTGFPGAGKTNKQLQATSGLIFDVFAQWDRDNPLLAQSTREVLERELEFQRLQEVLADLS
ncbi:MAG: ligase-associated DNA damage response DEXH box helicase, partial [Aeromicrobium sp.]|nr:ligase-associated DNA damage response DEXH box helicase [Burkholderiales bacterium]